MNGYAVVTGGADGLGWTIAELLVQRGWEVVLADRNATLGTQRAALSAQLEFIELDVSDGAEVESAFQALADERGPLSLLVNNAGIQRAGSLVDLTDADWRAIMGVDLDGAFYCLKAAGRQMVAAGRGSAVNIVSVAAERGVAARAAYAAAKAGLVSLTRSAAVEWAPHGIRVNAVGPGYVDTVMLQDAIASGRLHADEILERIPQSRFAKPADIASVVAFLSSDEASYINGQTIYVDGGFLAEYGVKSR